VGEASLPPRLFAADEEVRAIARGLLARDLPRPLWTHEAHLAAIICILTEHPEILAERDMPVIISSYNVAAGGVNDDTQGYHEAMTQVWIHVARRHVAAHPGLELLDLANGFIAGPDGGRDVLLRHYSRDRLFSLAARRSFVTPDLLPLSAAA